MPTTPLDIFNAFEAVLWSVIGLEFLRRGLIAQSIRRSLAWRAGITFLLFGISDIVEIQTDAFWRPWWLLVWKGACITMFIILWLERQRRRRTATEDPK